MSTEAEERDAYEQRQEERRCEEKQREQAELDAALEAQMTDDPYADNYDKRHLDNCHKNIYDRKSSPCTCRDEWDRLVGELRAQEQATRDVQALADQRLEDALTAKTATRRAEQERDKWRAIARRIIRSHEATEQILAGLWTLVDDMEYYGQHGSAVSLAARLPPRATPAVPNQETKG